jgi:N-acetylglucosaminyldiphosphoundecaprenol N-acetyl-beta-D-mannosaminyltransferase
MIENIKKKIIDIDVINNRIDLGEDVTISFINPYSYTILREKNNLYKKIDYFCADGILLTKMLNMFFSLDLKRTSFDMTSLAPIVFKNCVKNNKTIYFVGAKSQEINKSINIISQHYPNLKISGYRNGYFENSESRKEEIDRIVRLKPHVVVVGMGTPLQEEFLLDIKNEGWIGTGFTCGGFLHQTQEKLYYYPKIIDALNLRWLYRLFKERLFSRLKEYPKFFYVFFSDLNK